jgi:alpha/beta superfamily hydrolase
MHTKVVYEVARGLGAAGLHTLRFNYRGVGLSAPGPRGEDPGGRQEREDIRAAVRWLAAKHPGASILLAGFSFGARYGLEIGLQEDAVVECLAVGLAVRLLASEVLAGGAKPTTFLHGDDDALGPLADVQALAATWRAPAQVEVIRGADHFFAGHLPAVREAARAVALGQLSGRAAS